MTNAEIAKLLRNVAAAMTILNDREYHFQLVAYEKAADIISASAEQVTDLVREGKLADVKGIGEIMRGHLTELVTKGKVKHFETFLKKIPAAVFPLLDVPSIGPKRAYKLVTELHLSKPETVIADLKKKLTSEKLTIERFGETSQQALIRALEEFGKGAGKTTRMLLPFADKIAMQLTDYLKKIPEVHQAEALGSLRRRVFTVGDIDIAVASNEPEKVIAHFVQYPYKSRVIEQGPNTASLLTSGGQQVDLMVQPIEGFGSLLQHFTGSKHHNVHLRDLALRKKLSLSEYGIKRLDKKSEVREKYKTEEEFYNAMGLEWVPPEMREDRGEIELAEKHSLPHLVELKDIKGDLHTHSSYPIEPSHDLGLTSMEDMLKKAEQLGYEYLGFSEHNPSVSQHTERQIFSILQKRDEHIEHIKSNIKSVRVIKLLEIDILANGSLSVDDKSLSLLDAGIVSIHSSFGMSKEKMTQRILAGLSHPKVKILAHPTGRLFGSRESYDVDWDTLFDFCKTHNKALEINAWPERTDLPDTLIQEAIKHGVKMVIDTDSHEVSHMDLMQYGVYNARRGWAEKKDILNTLGYNEFAKWLKGGE